MIIFLYGRDGYRLKQNLDKIVAQYQAKYSGMGLAVLDSDVGSQSSDLSGGRVFNIVQKLEDLVKTVPFFDEKRLIILKNAFSAARAIADLIKKWGLASDKQRVLVFVENWEEKELQKKDRELFNLLSAKPNIIKSFESLEGKQLENWAKEEIESLGSKIEFAALKKLISYATNPPSKDEPADPANIWRLKQEIDKLVNYKSTAESDNTTKNSLINASDIELLVGPNVNLNIFEVIDAIASKNRYKAAAVLYNHLEKGVDPYYIFSMIVYQFRNLLKVKALTKNAVPYADIIKKTGLNPYVVKKTYEQSKKFDLDELKRLFAKLAQLEISAKSGSIDMAEGLYQFTFSLNA